MKWKVSGIANQNAVITQTDFWSRMEDLHVYFKNTVNRERFAGLNFRVFHGFQEYRESFSVDISASL